MTERIKKLSHEDLVSELLIVSTQEILYPQNTNYSRKRLECEKELIMRLGGDWNKYCYINSWNDTNNKDF